jgi:ABC-2 type transport system ATP-binding protein
MLDEPTSALDPIGRKDVLDMIESLGGRTTVFFSTHILSDVERVCDTVAILHEGRVVTQAPIDELKSRYGTSKLVVEVTEAADEFAERFACETWVSEIERLPDGAMVLTLADTESAWRAVPAMVAERGVGLKRLEPGEVSLEEVFVDLVGGDS